MILLQFLRFLVNPLGNVEITNIRKKLIDFVVLFFCSLILVYGLTIVLQLLFQAPASSVEDLPFVKLVLFGLLLAPLFEELVFRLSMVYSKLYISISLSLYITSLITSFLDIRLLTLTGGISFFLFLCVFYIFLNNHKTAHIEIEKFWKEHYSIIFYSLTILFGAFHIANYDLTTFSALLLAILFSVPQIIGALFLGFVRIRLGFIWAVLMHVLFNAVPFGLMFLM